MKIIYRLVYILCLLFFSMSITNAAQAEPEDTLPFETIGVENESSGWYSAEPGFIVVATPDDLTRIRPLISPTDYEAVQAIDYDQYFTIALFHGLWSRGHEAPEISMEQIRRADSTIQLIASSQTPESDLYTLDRSPYHLVQIEKDNAWGESYDFKLRLNDKAVLSKAHFIPSRDLSFETVGQSPLDSSEYVPQLWSATEPEGFMITTLEGLSALENFVPVETLKMLQTIDYDQQFAFALYQGLQDSTGYGIEIEQVRHQQGEIQISASTIQPAEGDSVGMQETSPYHIVKLDKKPWWDKQLNFTLSINGEQGLPQPFQLPNTSLEIQSIQKMGFGFMNTEHPKPDIILINTTRDIPLLNGLVRLDEATLEAVDYSKYFVAALFDYGHGSTEYEISIQQARREGNRLKIDAYARYPFVSQPAGDAETSPYHIVKIGREGHEWDREVEVNVSFNGTQTLTRTATLAQNLPIPTPTLAPTSTPTPTPIPPVIIADDYTAAPGSTFDVLIEATDLENVALVSVNVSYDPTVLQAVSCRSFAVEPGDGQCNANFSSDTVRFNVVRTRGIGDDVNLARITFEVIGQIGNVSPIQIEVDTIVDISGEHVAVNTLDGQVSIGQNLAISRPTPAPTSQLTPTPSGPVIMAGDYIAAPGDKISVIIESVNFEDIRTVSVDVSYDPTVLQAVSCRSFAVEFALWRCNANFSSDTVRFNVAKLERFNDDVKLARITFEVIGQIGNVSPIHIEVDTIDDISGEYVAVDTIDGQVSISDTESICNESLPFESLEQGENFARPSDQDDYGFHPYRTSTIVVSDWDEVEELQRRLGYRNPQLLRSVDYNEYVVLIVVRDMPVSASHPQITINEVCIQDETISIGVQMLPGTNLTLSQPYHMILVKKDSSWDQEMNFAFSLNGPQNFHEVFTHTHAIPGPRLWDTLAKSESAMAEIPDLMVIANKDEIASVADILPSGAISALQALDYEESYGLVAFQGQQPSGSYDIEIENLSREGNRVVVHTQATEPAPDSPVTPEGTSPYHLIWVDRFYENGDELDFVLSINGTETLTRTATIDQNSPIPTPTPTPTSTPNPTSTPVPTLTSTPVPTNTPEPTSTSTPTNTSAPIPISTFVYTNTPTSIPASTSTPTPIALAWVNWFEVAASSLNMDVEQLSDAVDQGQSIAEIATANNIASQAVVSAIINAEQAMIEEGIANGLLPQGEAEEWMAKLPEVAAHFVEDAESHTDVAMINGVDWFTVAAQAIGLEDEDFWIIIEQGQNIAEIANTNDSDHQNVVDAIVQAETNLINQNITNGLVSQDDANEWLAELDDFVTEFVETNFMDDAESAEDEENDPDGTGRGESNDSEVLKSSLPTTIQVANMTLILHKNARAKTSASFPDNYIYLPVLMK